MVAGPGDVNRLYLGKGLAQGSLPASVGAQQSSTQTDTWQFEVGPTLNVTQFRRAIATVSIAGLFESEAGRDASTSWVIQSVFADFDDDAGLVRVSTTGQVSIFNPTTDPFDFAGLSALAYDVSILAAMPAA